MRKIIHPLLVAALLAHNQAVVAGEPVGKELVYACSMGDRDAFILNMTRHRFIFGAQVGDLNEGLNFNFTTKAGYLVRMDLGDTDRIHFNKPRRIRGWGSVTRAADVSGGKLESIYCVRMQ